MPLADSSVHPHRSPLRLLNRFKLLVPALCLALPWGAVHAQTTWTWTGTAGTSAWATAGNWDLGTAPSLASTTLHHVIINSGEVLTANVRDIGRNHVGSTQTVTGGTLTITGTHRYGVRATYVGDVEGTGHQTGGTVISTGALFLGQGSDSSGTYNLSGASSVLEASHFTVGSGAGSVGVLNHSSGTFRADGPLGSFIGQNGAGTYNLSGGTLSRNSAQGIALATGATSTGLLNQTGGSISLLGGGGLAVSGGSTAGLATYSIANGSINAGFLIVGVGAGGTVNVGQNATMAFVGDLTLGNKAVLNFAFGPGGVSPMNFGGAGSVDPAAAINVDGSAYTLGAQTFTLISSTGFTGTPLVALTGFSQGATYDWDVQSGLFTVTVIPEPSAYAVIAAMAAMAAVACRRRLRA
jgi:hypothetical protein